MVSSCTVLNPYLSGWSSMVERLDVLLRINVMGGGVKKGGYHCNLKWVLHEVEVRTVQVEVGRSL